MNCTHIIVCLKKTYYIIAERKNKKVSLFKYYYIPYRIHQLNNYKGAETM